MIMYFDKCMILMSFASYCVFIRYTCKLVLAYWRQEAKLNWKNWALMTWCRKGLIHGCAVRIVALMPWCLKGFIHGCAKRIEHWCHGAWKGWSMVALKESIDVMVLKVLLWRVDAYAKFWALMSWFLRYFCENVLSSTWRMKAVIMQVEHLHVKDWKWRLCKSSTWMLKKKN